MCNSYAAKANYSEYVEAFSQVRLPLVWPEPHAAPNLQPRDPVRPTDPAPILRPREGGVELVELRFGFMPGRPKAGPIINYRSENRRFAHGRCLAPVSWFYEYTGERSPKTRWKVSMPGQAFFCLAGVWRRADGEWPESFTLLTVDAGPDLKPYHARQVVPLHPGQWAGWIDGSAAEAELLHPSPPGVLKVEPAPREA
jgi:putative SOS response-associated peptidase YedK